METTQNNNNHGGNNGGNIGVIGDDGFGEISCSNIEEIGGYGGTTNSGSMASKPSSVVANIFRNGGKIEDNNGFKKNNEGKKKPSNVINKTCVSINEIKATLGKVRQTQKQTTNKVRHIKHDIEQTLLEVQTISESMKNKFLSTFSDVSGRKRTFLDNDERVNFEDIEKDFQSINSKFEVPLSDVDCSMTLSDADRVMALSELKEKAIIEDGGRGGDRGGRDNHDNHDACNIPNFLHKLYNMVEKEEINDLISWNLPHCDSIVISDINKFATHVLPMYFTHSNFSSFNSQLNLYGFKKVSWEKHQYANEWFQRGRYDLLVNIKRRNRIPRLTGFAMTSTTKAETLNNRLKRIQCEQENKIISLLMYEEQKKSSIRELKQTLIKMAKVVDNMIQKRSEKLESVKKSRLEFGKNVAVNEKEHELNVIELETALGENKDSEAHSYSQELWIDPKVLEKILMEDPWFE